MNRIWLVWLGVACSDFDVRCGAAGRATRAESQIPDACEDALCLSEIVASNHNLGVKRFTPACPVDGAERLSPCEDDYIILEGRSDTAQVLASYELIRDDISYAKSALNAALPLDAVLADPDNVHAIEPVYEVAHEQRVLVFMELRVPRPDWMVPHDLGSEWGTVRLQRDGCEVDHTYYPSLKSNKLEVDEDEDGELDEQDRAWSRKDDGCPDGLQECWRVACPSYQKPGIGCDVVPP